MPPLRSGQQAEVAHPPEAPGHQVTRKAPQERRPAHGHLLGSAFVPVVLVVETHRALLFIHSFDALVAHRDAARVAGQIPHHRTGVAQGRPAEDVPVAPRQFHPPVTPRLEGFKPLRPARLRGAFQHLDAPQQDRPEDLGHGTHRKQIVAARLTPVPGGQVASARADEHMQMRVPVERAAPGVEHSQKPALHPPVVRLEELERLRSRPEQRVGREPVVRLEKSVQLLRHREHHMEMGTVRQPLADLLRPFRLPRSKAVRTVPVAARTGIPLLMPAVLATRMIVAQRTLAAEGHQVERRILLLAQSSGPEVAPLAQNTVDGRFDAAYLNSMSAVAQVFRYPLNFINCFNRRFSSNAEEWRPGGQNKSTTYKNARRY